MNRIKVYGCLFLVLVYIGAVHGQDESDTVTGKILEINRNEYFIQVRDYSYKVEMVLVDFGGSSEPVMGNINDLEEGSVVEVYLKGVENGFRLAEKVIVFKGSKEKEILKTLE